MRVMAGVGAGMVAAAVLIGGVALNAGADERGTSAGDCQTVKRELNAAIDSGADKATIRQRFAARLRESCRPPAYKLERTTPESTARLSADCLALKRRITAALDAGLDKPDISQAEMERCARAKAGR